MPGELGPGGDACGTLLHQHRPMDQKDQMKQRDYAPLRSRDGGTEWLGVSDARLVHHVITRVEVFPLLQSRQVQFSP